MSRVYGPFGATARRLYTAAHPAWGVCGRAMAGPAVYIVHHQNMLGPVHAVAFLPVQARIWALHVFLSRKECFAQYYGYTFTSRFGWPKPAARLAAGLLSVAVPALVNSLGAIPVFRGRAEVAKTMQLSQQALCNGESLIICPDVEYSDSSPGMGKMYTGFLKLEQEYFAQTGRHLAFVPTHCSPSQKRFYIGQPVYFEGGENFSRQRKVVAQSLQEAINTLGRAAGDIQECPGSETHNSVQLLSQ